MHGAVGLLNQRFKLRSELARCQRVSLAADARNETGGISRASDLDEGRMLNTITVSPFCDEMLAITMRAASSCERITVRKGELVKNLSNTCQVQRSRDDELRLIFNSLMTQ